MTLKPLVEKKEIKEALDSFVVTIQPSYKPFTFQQHRNNKTIYNDLLIHIIQK